MSKICPKCDKEHSKPGTFCSRACANSRQWPEERRLRQRSNFIDYNASLTPAQRVSYAERGNSPEAKAKRSLTWANKMAQLSWDEMKWGMKRSRIITEQNGCCARCGISEWMGAPICLEIDHIDGNRSNDSRENLSGNCPNCHSQTETWRGRKNTGKVQIEDSVLLELLLKHKNVAQALTAAGLAPKGRNYDRAWKLLESSRSRSSVG